MKGLLLLPLLTLVLSFSPALGQERFPPWVPPEAVQAAEYWWQRVIGAESSSQAPVLYGVCKEDLSRSQLWNPRKIVDIDYESYQPGADIVAMLR
jgi:hypothetical protein